MKSANASVLKAHRNTKSEEISKVLKYGGQRLDIQQAHGAQKTIFHFYKDYESLV